MSADRPLTSFDFGGGESPPVLTPVPPQFPADVPPELARRFRESYDWFNYGGYPAAGPAWAQFDGASNLPAGYGRGATGQVGDRRGGKDLPRFWSELDLHGYRVMSRWLWDTNPFMIGFGGRLVDYHIGKGWQWQACLKGQKKQAYATSAGPDASKSPDAKLVKKAQNILDGWRDRVNWPLRSREGFRRLHRDGEVCQRFFRGERGDVPAVRWVNSEQIGSPAGDTNTDDSYGVRTAPGDSEHVLEVFVRDHDGDGSAGEWVNADRFDPASRVLFFTTNTDADVKRGLPDSFSVHETMDESKKLVRNMVVVACAQAAVAWLEKFPAASAEQVRALIPTGAPRYDVPAYAGGYGETVYSEKMAAGTVLRVEGNREFAPGPASASVSSYVEAEQAALRMACVRWGFPPYMTAKADDINFASSLTSGSPFAVAVEGGQVEWGTVERATALKVLDLAVESGLLTWEERRQLDVEVIAPTVAGPDPGQETQRNKILFDAKVLDPYTWMQREGLDPSHIEANWKAWNERNPGPAAAAPPGTPPPPPKVGAPAPAPDDDPFGGSSLEAVLEGFTGTIRDKRGAELHYQDGKRVASAPKAAGGGFAALDHGPGQVARRVDGVHHSQVRSTLAGLKSGRLTPEQAKTQAADHADKAKTALKTAYAKRVAALRADAAATYGEAALDSPEWQAVESHLAAARDNLTGNIEDRADEVARNADHFARTGQLRADAADNLDVYRQEGESHAAAVMAGLAEEMDYFKSKHKPVLKAGGEPATEGVGWLVRESADRSHLVPKEITDALGHKRTVYVNPQARASVDGGGKLTGYIHDHPTHLAGGVNTHGHAADSPFGKLAAAAETGKPKEIADAARAMQKETIDTARAQGRNPEHVAAAAELVADLDPVTQKDVRDALRWIGKGYADDVAARVKGSELIPGLVDTLKEKDRQQVLDYLSRAAFDDFHPQRDANDFDLNVRHGLALVVDAVDGDKELATKIVAAYRARVLAPPQPAAAD